MEKWQEAEKRQLEEAIRIHVAVNKTDKFKSAYTADETERLLGVAVAAISRAPKSSRLTEPKEIDF